MSSLYVTTRLRYPRTYTYECSDLILVEVFVCVCVHIWASRPPCRIQRSSLVRWRGDLLAENENPFVLFVVKTFETKSRVTMLTELVQGGDLYALIRTIPTVLSKKRTMAVTRGLL